MRACQPQLFTETILPEVGALELESLRAHQTELTLAETVFEQALGQPAHHLDRTRDEMVLALNELYQRYGISSEYRQTERLVDELEARARQQAELFIHGSRSR